MKDRASKHYLRPVRRPVFGKQLSKGVRNKEAIMEDFTPISELLSGLLSGLAAAILLLLNGLISGIVGAC